MPVYIALITLNEKGREAVKTNPKKIKINKAAIEAMGVKVLAQYITLGQYDFVNVLEAKDEKHILKAAVNLTGIGIAHTETLAALTVEDYLKLGKK